MSKPTEEKSEKHQVPFVVFEATVSNRITHIYLSTEIGEPKDYIEVIHRIQAAQLGDVIYIHLNTPGGRLDTGVQILNAMAQSPAKVVTILESMAHSLGTLLFLAGDEYVVHDNCLMMFHNMSSGTFGKGNEQVAQLEATMKWWSKLLRKIGSPFLTKKEIDSILKGEDLWIDSDEIRRRLIQLSKQRRPQKTAARIKPQAQGDAE